MQTEKISVRVPKGLPPKLVTDYVNRCHTTLPAVVTALDRSDLGYLRIFGHRLKGTGGAYGIPALTEIGSAIEAAAGRNDTTELRREVAKLEECLSRIEILSN